MKYYAGTVIALTLVMLSANGLAQPVPDHLPEPPDFTSGQGQLNGLANERFERQEFREEMEKIRRDHEDMERARDHLLDTCVNVSGAQIADCQHQKEELHDRARQLHERTIALHEKIQAARKTRASQDSNLWPQTAPDVGLPPPAR